MVTIDMTQRKLSFPPRFLPYLEKHRIFELLHECVELLVQVRPKDHIQFLKTILPCAARKKDKQRIVFLSPPSFDRGSFVDLIADCLGLQTFSRAYLEMLTRERKMVPLKIPEVESVEEESCICPGEGGFLSPMYYPEPEEAAFVLPSPEEEEVVEEEEPCPCVCPCVLEEREKLKGQDGNGAEGDEEGKKGEGEEGGEGGEEEGEGEEPCERSKKKKRRKEKLQPCRAVVPAVASSLGSTEADIDYSLLAECDLVANGWILKDVGTTGAEAEMLSSLGVIPTHAFRLIVNEEEEANDREYKWRVVDWMKAYAFVPVIEIRVGGRSLEQLSQSLCSLLQVMPHRHAPMLPRLVLIGSRGSGVTTQGQKLAKKYRLVHVEFELVIARTLQQNDRFSQLYKQQMATRVEPELEAVILEKALLTSACRNRGWVLTGYPTNIDQMRMLDMIATPPNRIIFLEVPPRECFVRLFYRKIDPCLGTEYKLPEIEPFGLQTYQTPEMDSEIAARLVTHPKNDRKQIIHDIEKYFLEKEEMMAYCGKTASYVDGDKTVDNVFERIEQVIINPSPAQPPRSPFVINHGIEESYERLKKFRISPEMFLNDLFLNPPEAVARI